MTHTRKESGLRTSKHEEGPSHLLRASALIALFIPTSKTSRSEHILLIWLNSAYSGRVHTSELSVPFYLLLKRPQLTSLGILHIEGLCKVSLLLLMVQVLTSSEVSHLPMPFVSQDKSLKWLGTEIQWEVSEYKSPSEDYFNMESEAAEDEELCRATSERRIY